MQERMQCYCRNNSVIGYCSCLKHCAEIAFCMIHTHPHTDTQVVLVCWHHSHPSLDYLQQLCVFSTRARKKQEIKDKKWETVEAECQTCSEKKTDSLFKHDRAINLISWSLILMKRQNVRTEGKWRAGWRGGAKATADKLETDIDIMHIWPKSCSLCQTDPKYSLSAWETQHPGDISAPEQTNCLYPRQDSASDVS